MVGQVDGASTESGEKILEKMDFEKAVEENGEREEKGEQVVGERDEGESTEKKRVGIGDGGEAIGFHGGGGGGRRVR